MVHCCVLGCKSRSERKETHLSFHSFPKHPHIRKSWILSTGRLNWEPKRYDRICSKHFVDNCFQKNYLKVYINPHSVPTLNVHNSVRACTTTEFEAYQQEIETQSKTQDESTSDVPAEMLTNAMEKIKEIDIPPHKKVLNEQETKEESQTPYNSEENNKSDIKQECRACLSQLNPDCNAYYLFQKWDTNLEGSELTLADDMSRICNVQISLADGYSKVICSLCYKALLEASNFAALVRRNDSTLRMRPVSLSTDFNGRDETMWPKPIDVNKNVSEIIISNAMEVEVKKEVLSDDEYNDCNNGSDFVFKPVEDIKIEPEDYVEQLTPVFSYMNGTTLDDNSSLVENGYDHSNACESEEYLDTVVKSEPISEEDGNDTPPSDLPLQCILCTKDFLSVSGLKAHVIAQHSYKTVKRKSDDELSSDDDKKRKTDRYICDTCKRCFATCTDLMVHETCHNKHACYMCGGQFDTFALLAAHRVHCSTSRSLLPQISAPRARNSPHGSNGLHFQAILQETICQNEDNVPGTEIEKNDEQRDSSLDLQSKKES